MAVSDALVVGEDWISEHYWTASLQRLLMTSQQLTLKGHLCRIIAKKSWRKKNISNVS